jgi:two-component system, chemotaxis family, CheB/CheR fusion protein
VSKEPSLTKPKQRAPRLKPSPEGAWHPRELFPIVGVGASAGGLEAFRRLLGALPKSTGMAYVLVQHLDPHHESILAALLSEVTQMHVAEVQGDVRVEPNHVYVIPPSKGLVLVEGVLKLVPRAPGAAHMPIDSFLKTLADVQGSQAVGVILSGMGTDGTLGLRAIEAAGGIAFAQEPTSAQNADMPRSAIAAGVVDFVLTPEDIASELKRLGQHPYLAVAADGTPDAEAPTSAHQDSRDEREGLAKVLELLRKIGGTDFSAYKKTTLRRRIARRMAVSRIETLQSYAVHLAGNAVEAAALYEDCLISVTSFFRDAEVFDILSEQILPILLKDRPSDAPLRVWVPGCATGEEAYSIAMCLLERMAKLASNPALQIFATDLSEGALAKAREGRYLVNIARDVSPERLRRFFTKDGDHYQISKAIREMCIFARHDLTADPPYSRLDLVSCRNVLIYMEPRLQELVFATFHYALGPDGFLIVGPAETVGASSPLFATVDDRRRIYSRKAVSGPPRLLAARGNANPTRVGVQQLARKPSASEVPRETDRMLLARFGPAAVVVDESLRVLEFRGDTEPFLEHGHGKATLSLERLVRKGLLMELRQAIAEARRTGEPVRKPGLQVRHRQSLQSVCLEVVPISGRAAAERCLLVLFEREGSSVIVDPTHAALATRKGDGRDLEIERLGQGLAQTTEYVHTLVREHESALEELQSTTEEALSSNEELQSLNEELQTAKEEIQSANEELATLNQELQDRNVQLSRSNDDIQRGLDGANALLDTVPGPLVILDADLRVEKANVAFYELFKTRPELARGRPLAELGARDWGTPQLLSILRGTLESSAILEDQPLEVEFPGIGSRSISLNARRLHPERDPRGRLLLAIDDRTEIKRAERGREALLALEHEARTRAEVADQLKDEFVATASHELRGPLTVISGWMNILLDAGTAVEPAILAKGLAAIGRGVTAQGRLISDLLDHSRIVAGKVELRRVPIDLRSVAEAALVGVRAAASAKDIDLRLTSDGSPCVVLGDFDRMQQVLWNLFLNAVKFTPARGSVQVSVGRVVNQVEVRVRDTGCGISSEFLPHVFDRFRQAEGSSARMQPGLGLGLTLVRELIELHGGTVSAESPGRDQGATFTIVLPIPALLMTAEEAEPAPSSVPPRSELVPVRPLMAEPSAPLHHLLAGLRVLVVDDESDAREALVGLLERYGAEVRSAASVTAAMDALHSALPDVLISDVGMPGADGYELIRRVRLLPAGAGGRLPSLAVSAYATPEHRKKLKQSGFQRHLEKPVAAAELVTAVAQLAGRSAPPAAD